MDIKKRLFTVKLIEKMSGMPGYSRQLGLTDRSTFRGKPTAKIYSSENNPGNCHDNIR